MITLKEYRKWNEDEWKKKKVRTTIEMRNGYMVIPEGTVCSIDRKYNGFSLTSPPCETCGIKVSISRVRRMDLELAEGE